MTLTWGSSALDQPLPTYLQCAPRARVGSARARASFRSADSHGKHRHESHWPATVGASAGGRTDGGKLERRLQTNTPELRPDAAGAPVKRVTIEVSGTPGQLSSQMLSMFCGWGFCLRSRGSNPAAAEKRLTRVAARLSLFAGAVHESSLRVGPTRVRRSIPERLMPGCWPLVGQTGLRGSTVTETHLQKPLQLGGTRDCGRWLALPHSP